MPTLKEAIAKAKKQKDFNPENWREFFNQIAKDVVFSHFKELEENLKEEAEKFIEDYIDELLVGKLQPKFKGDKGDNPSEMELIGLIKPLIPEPLKGDPGEEGRPGKDGENGRDSLVPGPKGDKGDEGKPGKDGSPDTPEQIINKINTLEEKIEQKTIKGLPAFLKNLQNSFREATRKSQTGGGMGNWVHQSFSVNSSTTYVDLTYNVAANGYALMVFYQGQFIARGTHYTQSGKRITLTFAPDNNTTIDVAYVRT